MLFVSCSVSAESGGGGLDIARLTSYMIFNYGARRARNGRGRRSSAVSLPLRRRKQTHICPSQCRGFSLREVARPPLQTPTRDGQVRACPAPSVIKRPSCAVTSGGAKAGVIRDPAPAPSEERTQTLTGRPRVKPCAEYR